MPTILTHAVAGAGVALLATPHPSVGILALSAALGALPDIDTAGFYLGVSYRSFWGHRGFTHSLCCALLVSLPVAMLSTAGLTQTWWELWPVFFLAMMMHGLLDGCTNGGLGVAYFSPFDSSRYFLPWRPIQVSTIGLPSSRSFLLRVLVSEVCWVWLPLAVLIGIRLAATAFT
jgi:inner membrane protein